MAGDIIKEFLIKLGYKVDEESLKKFETGIASATKEVTSLGLKAAGAATAVTAAITKIAEQYEDLYFASIRTNAAASSLATFAYGSKAIGISAEQSAASLERLNVELLANPGKVALLNMMGIQTAGKDTKEVYDDLIGTLSRMPAYLRIAYAAQFGISPTELEQRIKLRKEQILAEAEYREKLNESGLSVDELTRKSHDYERALHSLGASVGIVWDQTANRWLPVMTEGVHLLDSWASWAFQAGKATQGMSSTILGLISALGGLKAFAWLLSFLPGAAGGAAAAASTGAGAVAGPLLGAGAMLTLLNAKEAQEHPLAGRGTRNDAAISSLPWYRRAAIWAQENVFGADANQFVGGGGGVGPKPKLSQHAALAIAMQHFGQHERVDRGQLEAFFQSQGLNVDPATTAWCAAFVNASLAEAGIKGSGSLAANSFYRWGEHVDTKDIQAGDVVTTGKHVGFATGKFDERGRPQVVAGNTGDKVNYFYPAQYETRRANLGMDATLTPAGQSPAGTKTITINQTNHVTGVKDPDKVVEGTRRNLSDAATMLHNADTVVR